MQILSNLTMIVQAGYDTSSSVLSFTIWEICKNPEIETRLVEEIKNLRTENDLTYDNL